MNVGHTEIAIELDAGDIAHLLQNGTTAVSDTDSDVNAQVKCADSASVEVVVSDTETNDE